MVVIENIKGFAEVLVKLAGEPIVFIVLAAEILKKEDIKKDGAFAKKIIKYAQALKGFSQRE